MDRSGLGPGGLAKWRALGQRVGPDAQIEIDPRRRQRPTRDRSAGQAIGYVSGQAETATSPPVVPVMPDTTGRATRPSCSPTRASAVVSARRSARTSTPPALGLTQDGCIAKGPDRRRLRHREGTWCGSSTSAARPAAPQSLLPSQLLAPGPGLAQPWPGWMTSRCVPHASVGDEQQLRVVLRERGKRIDPPHV